jgi:nucleoside-diphosphate-sugar epimerase
LNFIQFRGHSTQFVLGLRDVSYNEVAKILGSAIGKPDLKYVESSYEETEKRMIESGYISANVASLFSDLSRYFNNGSALTDHKRQPQNSTPTGIEEFSQVFAKVYLSS